VLLLNSAVLVDEILGNEPRIIASIDLRLPCYNVGLFKALYVRKVGRAFFEQLLKGFLEASVMEINSVGPLPDNALWRLIMED